MALLDQLLFDFDEALEWPVDQASQADDADIVDWGSDQLAS